MTNYNFLRKVDKLGGIVACSIIAVIDGFFPKPKKSNSLENEIRKILIIKFWGLGSILLASPAIRALRTKYPQAKITFLTLSRNREICGMLGLINEIVTVELDQGILRFVRNLVFSLLILRKEHFDLLLDLEFFTRFSAILTYLINARTSVGFNTWEVWRGNFHTVKVPFNRYWHMTKNFANLVAKLGVNVDCLDLIRPEVTLLDRQLIDKFLGQGKYECIVPINVNSDFIALERRWPKNYFVQLINYLTRKPNLKVVLVGSKRDVQYVQEILDELEGGDKIINLAGKINLPQLAALFERSSFFVTNDSGPLHFAIAMDVPTVSFFGPETPVLYGPPSEKHLVFFKNIDCSPCMNVHSAKTVKCCRGTAECMESIYPEEVIREIEKIFSFLENKMA